MVDMGTSSQTDAEIIAASLADPAAFEPIFDRHFGSISLYLRRRVSRAIADELASDVFAAAFASRSRYDPRRADARPWLYGIAANVFRRHRREEERELDAFRRTGVDPVSSAAEEPIGLLGGSLDQEVARSLLELDAADREVLLLFAWGCLSYEDIAYALSLPVGTVKSRLNRARRQVRDALAEVSPANEEAVSG